MDISANRSCDSLQQNEACNNELLDMVEKLQNYISTLPVYQLRGIPGFNEELHLSLSLQAYRLKQKYRTPMAKCDALSPSLMPGFRLDDIEKYTEELPLPIEQDMVTNQREQTPLTTDIEQVPVGHEAAQVDDDDLQVLEIVPTHEPRKTNRGFYISVKHKNYNKKHFFSDIAKYVLEVHPDEQGIVVCPDRKEAEALEIALIDLKVSVCRLSNNCNEKRSLEGKVNVLLYTSSSPLNSSIQHKLGFLIYTTLPIPMKNFRENLRILLPKKGRVDCLIFYSKFEVYKFKSMFIKDDEKAQRKRQVLYQVASFCEGSSCRKYLLTKTSMCRSSCVSCDNCLERGNSYEMVNASKEATEILKRLIKQSGNLTMTQVASRDKNKDKQSLTLKILRQLLLNGYLDEVASGLMYPTVVVTQKGIDAIANPKGLEITIERQKTLGDEEDDVDLCSILDESEFIPEKRVKLEKIENELDQDFEMQIESSYTLQRSNNLNEASSFEDSESDSQEG